MSAKITQQIPKTWQKKQIKDLLDYERPDKYIVESDRYINSGVPVLTANKSFILGYTDEKNGIYNDLPVIIFDDFTTDSKFVDFPFKIKSSAIKILKNKDNVDLRFVFEKMKSVNFPTGSHKRYYISQYQNMEVLIPPLPEQKKIAEILSTVDEEIKKTDEVIVATEKLKRGLMQRLFTRGIGHTKIKNVKLGSVARVQGGYAFKSKEFTESGVPVLRISNINQGKVDLTDCKFYKGEINERLKPFVLKSGDVVIAMSGATTGKIGRVKEQQLVLMNQRVGKFVPSEGMNNEYLYQIVSSGEYQKRIWDFAIGGAQPNVSPSQLEGIEIPVSEISEQRKIANVLSLVDEKISVNQKLKEELTLLKNGLMQDLLSGSKRVNV